MNTLFFITLAFACVYGAPSGNEIICQPGSQSTLDCNTCICSADGTKFSCTTMKCSTTKYFNEDGTLKKPGDVAHNPLLRNKRDKQVCTPGSSFNVDCNKCTCAADGSAAACTRRLCLKKREITPEVETHVRSTKSWGPAYIQGTSCTPGEQFSSECNTCVCDPDGQSAGCTLMLCV
ncbi:pacifastin-like protease inhibitor cvp4 [Cephus cinctus]|uniref:Protease inhibitor n=1 Tax=Cephus cinctus TaxID=211228 RepID=A0AAJ7BJN8_CEPCN|nr:pacifastin-like protease inhibitor cvp4 [Cephus cinctus]